MITLNALQNVRLKFLSSSKLCEKYAAFSFGLEEPTKVKITATCIIAHGFKAKMQKNLNLQK